MDRAEYDVVVVQQPESGNLLVLTNFPPAFSGNACILSHGISHACLPHPLLVHLASYSIKSSSTSDLQYYHPGGISG